MGARLLLIRHAQSEWNAEGRWQGWADPPLSASGTTACVEARRDPTLTDVDAAAASDLLRARVTAELLSEGRATEPVLALRGLRERSAGQWTGLTRPEIEQRWPGALRTTPASIPGGEAVASVTARAVAALHRVGGHHAGHTVLVVSHGALIRAVCHHLGVTPEHVPNLGGLWLEVRHGRLHPGRWVEPLGSDLIERAG